MQLDQEIIKLCRKYLNETDKKYSTLSATNLNKEIYSLLNNDIILYTLYINASISLKEENYEYMNEITEYIEKRLNNQLTLDDIRKTDIPLYHQIEIDQELFEDKSIISFTIDKWNDF